MQAIEVTGTIDENGRLILDRPLQLPHPSRVRILVLLEDSNHLITGTQETQPQISSGEQSPETERFSFDPNAIPIWELAAEISAQVPEEEWKKLPSDLARRFDYYQKQRQEKD
jgi:hypothetical protein